MLRLKGITKKYKVASGDVDALKGLDVCFRKSEFVSILGPSGCGKTTTLNIVGGLDKYTSGDLIIMGKSTKNFKDHDWDIYRNQRIGFIFQSYNLIPHQTVLGNVELALTISGISKEERVARSLRALERVGLKGEEYKRPNQLSGGQCQRVAIARALVNEPDILLADEPTGALDSKTSVQIMELIKEISKDKLVIMVTHNGEIAEQYSTRIIRLVDGEIIEDTNPYSEEDEAKEYADLTPETGKKKKKKNQAKMSWWTAFKLSARNLLSKRKRTLLTSIAGSIGIIGISAVLAVSSGVSGYIDNMQDDMLSGNPITVTETAFDLDAMMNGLTTEEKIELVKEQGYVNVDSMLAFLAEKLETMDNMLGKNDISQEYIDYIKALPNEQATVFIDKGLNVANNIYTDFTGGGQTPETETISLSALKTIYTSVMKDTKFAENASIISSLGQVFKQAPNDNDYILSQYDVLKGELATEKDEIMIVVNSDWELTDMALGQLGYYSQKEFINIAYKATDDEEYKEELDIQRFSYDELMGKQFVWYDNDTVFTKNTDVTSAMLKPFTYNYSAESLQDGATGLPLKIVGILSPKENLNYGCLEAGFYYTEAFANHVVEENKESQLSQYLSALKSQSLNTYFDENGNAIGQEISFVYDYYDIDDNHKTDVKGYVGSSSGMGAIAGMFGMSSMGDSLSLTYREIGGDVISNNIKIYAKDLEMKALVIDYLDKWNDENTTITVGDKVLNLGDEGRSEIKYTDTLSIIMSMLTSMVDIVTIALISFTSLALVVSCVMISIITYVSVVERIKEIGVIRSLGGRKKDVSNLFNAETLMIGTASGIIGIGFTYFMSFIVNIFVKGAIGFPIMTLQIPAALIMLGLSIGLTVLSGLIPAKKASRQDPVVALRTE